MSGANTKMKWFHWLELILPFYLIINPIILSINGKTVMGLDVKDWLIWYGFVLSSVLFLGFLSYKKLGSEDFRFNMFTHILVVGVAASVVSLMIPGSGIFDIETIDSNVLFVNLIFLMLPMMVVLTGGMLAIYALTDPFTLEVGDTTRRFKNGELNTQIENEQLKHDSVFGPITTFINEIIVYAKSLVEEVATTSQIIADSSNNLAVGAEEVNSSAEEVASTSQAMSDGATSQTEMITEVNERINDLQSIMNDIVKKIQLNTQEVSQISLQTNILALNAGIEASRAGDYGRGFAVVAENVRKLSDQSKLASERIETVADEINNVIIRTFTDITSLMLNVVSVSEETAASAEEVAAAAEEMTSTMEEVSALSGTLSEQAKKSNNLLSHLSIK